MKEPETGKKENTGKSGYSITTWRLHLWCRHPEWLRTTQEFYNRIAEFYYNLLLDHMDLWEMGSQQTLRELEIMSIPGRGGRIPSDPLPWQKVPLYFRRAAANEGIASAKSYLSRFAQDEKIGRAEKLNAAVTYYKGMYQDFSAKEITLRVWTGDTWTWMHCRLSGRDFPENARLMSPSVVFEYKYDMLHVPVRQNNENTARDHYLSTTFLAICLFVYTLKSNWHNKGLAVIGRKCSTWLYIIHPIFITAFSVATGKLGIKSIYRCVAPIVTYCATLTFLIVMCRLKSLLVKNNQRK